MRYQIPQFIETEDKIVGPLTLKQFLYMAGFGGCALILFFVLDGIFAILMAFPLIALGIAFAFVKMGGMPLPRYLASMVGFAFEKKEYTWNKDYRERAGVYTHSRSESAPDRQPDETSLSDQ